MDYKFLSSCSDVVPSAGEEFEWPEGVPTTPLFADVDITNAFISSDYSEEPISTSAPDVNDIGPPSFVAGPYSVEDSASPATIDSVCSPPDCGLGASVNSCADTNLFNLDFSFLENDNLLSTPEHLGEMGVDMSFLNDLNADEVPDDVSDLFKDFDVEVTKCALKRLRSQDSGAMTYPDVTGPPMAKRVCLDPLYAQVVPEAESSNFYEPACSTTSSTEEVDQWFRRQKNNEASRRSRAARKQKTKSMESEMEQLSAENKRMRLVLKDLDRVARVTKEVFLSCLGTDNAREAR